MSDVLDYLQSKGLSPTIQGSEAVIICPVCGREKLSVNIETGLSQCWHCKGVFGDASWATKTHISKIKEFYGDSVEIRTMAPSPKKQNDNVNFNEMANAQHEVLLQNKEAIRYLINRGISKESIIKFKLGIEYKLNHAWVSIPVFSDGICKLIKYRQIPPEDSKIDKYIREAGGKSILFNEDCLKEHDEVIIAEGEFSAIAAIQAGFENVVSPTVGCGTLDPEWYEKLYLKDKIVLVFDNDTAGQTAAKDVWAKRLGLAKTFNVVLPEGKDIDEYLQNHTKEDFESLIQKATRFQVEGVMSIHDAILNMYHEGQNEIPRLSTPWKAVNQMLGGGLRRKELLTVGGQAAVGKTSFCLQMAHHFAKNHDIPAFFFCLEMDEVALATKIVQNEMDLAYHEISPSDAFVYLDRLSHISKKIFVGYKRNVTTDIFYNTVREARNRYGCEIVFFDNLQLLCSDGEEGKIATAMADFKAIAMDLDIMMVLVSQPRKLNDESKTPNFDDLKGSSAIGQTSDAVILLHRRRTTSQDSEASFEDTTTLIGDKARFASGGKNRLKFLGDKSKYVDWD